MLIHNNIKITTTNCRDPTKINQEKKQQKNFIRFLHNIGSDILILQETYAHPITLQDAFDCNFKSTPVLGLDTMVYFL